jgi:hypothetical protein
VVVSVINCSILLIGMNINSPLATEFTLAKDSLIPKYGDPTISIEKAQQLVVDAAREYFDNSVSGNMYSGNMKLAAEW